MVTFEFEHIIILAYTRIQGSLFASDIKMCIGICLCDVASTHKQLLLMNEILLLLLAHMTYVLPVDVFIHEQLNFFLAT